MANANSKTEGSSNLSFIGSILRHAFSKVEANHG
jgi:hypothetical protein